MTQQALTATQFSVVSPESFYTVNGVMLPGGGYGSVQVTQDLLDGRRSRTPAGWAEHRSQSGWGPGSGPLQTALFTSLYEHRDEEGVEGLRRLFADDFRTHWMTTATGITYRAAGLDVVTHDAGTPEERTLETCLTGPNGRIDAGMSGALQALLGTGDVDAVRGVYKWVTGHEPHLWRLNERQKQDVGRALVLGYDLGDFFNADIVFNGSRPARGVRVVPQNSTGSRG